jgi:hypothetical protein
MAEAILNGVIIDDGGLSCEIRFQYGFTPALGTFTAWKGWYNTGDTFQQLITGLPGTTTVYFRAEARNTAGPGIVGATLAFTTTTPAIPTVVTMAATLVREGGARLNGMVSDDAGKRGMGRFQWGLSTAYGMTTPWQTGLVTGGTFYADISSLAEGEAYHFRAQFKNDILVSGADVTFSTLSVLGAMTLVDDELMTLTED